MKWIFISLLPGLMMVSLFSQGEPAVNVDLGMIMDSFLPGDQVSVPIILVTRNEPQVAKISLEVAYPSELISFVGVTLGSGAEAAGAEVRTELVESTDSEGTERVDRTILLLEIFASNVIPQGLLLNLTFEMSEQIAINHEILLENLKLTAQSLDGQDIRARGLGGAIAPIEAIPACFFYMH
ncbi:MAG: hypothetical protein V3S50_07460 [Acidobacteriota bacterium]